MALGIRFFGKILVTAVPGLVAKSGVMIRIITDREREREGRARWRPLIADGRGEDEDETRDVITVG